MSDYWAERAAEQARKQYDKSLADLEKELSRYYRIALKGIQAYTMALYQKILDAMEQMRYIDTTDLHSLGRKLNQYYLN